MLYLVSDLIGLLQAAHTGMRPALVIAAGFMDASPFFPRSGPPGQDGLPPRGAPKGRGEALTTGAGGAGAAGAGAGV